MEARKERTYSSLIDSGLRGKAVHTAEVRVHILHIASHSSTQSIAVFRGHQLRVRSIAPAKSYPSLFLKCLSCHSRARLNARCQKGHIKHLRSLIKARVALPSRSHHLSSSVKQSPHMYQMLHHAASVVGRVCTLGCCLSHQTELPDVYVTVHENATSFLQAVGPWLQAEEDIANPILSHTETLSMLECRPSSRFGSSQNNLLGSTIWISSWSLPPSVPTATVDNTETSSTQATNTAPRLDFVAMVGTCHLGPLPVFLFAPSNSNVISDNSTNLMVGMRNIIAQISEAVPPERVCSTFGRAPLSTAFAAAWEAHTGYTRIPVPWRRTRMHLCLPRTLASTPAAEASATVRVREGVEDDIAHLADFCHQFSMENSPSPLTLEECTTHAYHLVSTHQAWVCEAIPHGTETNSSRIVSFCEISRRTKNTAAISKIFTLPPHRGKSYATRLLRDVLRLLFSTGTSSVVAYIPRAELFANCIFVRSGFGLYDQTEWIEWGFNGAGVSYW